MLSNYDYTLDLTSDADGAAETWGADGGYGIISASQMLAWVAANCGEACPGETKRSTRDLPYASKNEGVWADSDFGCPRATVQKFLSLDRDVVLFRGNNSAGHKKNAPIV